ncbi:MAG: FtsH protease activity modulator HflK [Alphaproteobacteria bacterium]|nr:FtsH protease activity modulator HflK [Alphaproteobacteria bacterium]
MAWGDKNDGSPQSPQSPWGGKPSGGGSGGGAGGGKEPPRGNNIPPDGPDFDALLRKAREQYQQMFGGGAGGGEGDTKKSLMLLAGGAAFLWLASGIYFIKADEQGVVTRFGVFTRTAEPGIHYHLPAPIEAVAKPRVTSINRIEVGYLSSTRRGSESSNSESLMLTGDENIVDVDFEVQWKISNAPDYLFNVREPDDTVKAVAESSMREVMGRAKIANVLADGKLQVEQDTKKLIQETLDGYKAGIEIVSVNLLKADPPLQVLDAFRDVQTARADLETARNQAEAYRNDITPKARGQAQQMILEAEGYKQEVIARAKGEASRFLAVYNEYKEAKDVTRKRMYLETMEEIMSGMTKVVMSNDASRGVVPYMPLPELKPRKTEEAGK